MYVTCIKEYKNKKVKVGVRYQVVDADMGEYAIHVSGEEVWISKNDIEHFKYEV